MRRGDYRRGLGRHDYRMDALVREESEIYEKIIPPDQIVSARARMSGILSLAVTFKTVENQQPVRMTFGLRT